MVYKRYITRKGKRFGPYYYESYRDKKGRVKTRYVDSPPREKKELHYNYNKIFLILGLILLFFVIGFLFFLINSNLTGKVILNSDIIYTLNQPISGDLNILLEPGDLLDSEGKIELELLREENRVLFKSFPVSDFFEGLLDPVIINNTSFFCENITIETIEENCSFVDVFNETTNLSESIETCENITLETIEENCSEFIISGFYFNQPGSYNRDISYFINYTFSQSGDYSLIFRIPLLNISIEKSFYISEEINEEREISILSTPGEIDSCQAFDTAGNYYLNDSIISLGSDCFIFPGPAQPIYFFGNGYYITGDETHTAIVTSSSDNSNIFDTLISDFDIGIEVSGDSLIIQNNTISHAITGAIYLAAASRIRVQDNFIYHSRYGLDILEPSNYIDSVNNFLVNNTYGILINGRLSNFSGGSIINSSDCAICIDSLGMGAGYSNIFSNISINSGLEGAVDLKIIGDADYNVLLDQSISSYNFSGAGNKLIVRNSNFGQISFLEGINGTGENLSSEIRVQENYIYINNSNTGLNKSANITFYGLSTNFIDPQILKNGEICTDCYNFTSLNAGTVVFNVSEGGSYRIYSDSYCGDGICSSLNSCNPVIDLDCRGHNELECELLEDDCAWQLGGCYEIVPLCSAGDELTCNSYSSCVFNGTDDLCNNCIWGALTCNPDSSLEGQCTPNGSSEDCSSCSEDCGSCCGNGVCDIDIGATCHSTLEPDGDCRFHDETSCNEGNCLWADGNCMTSGNVCGGIIEEFCSSFYVCYYINGSDVCYNCVFNEGACNDDTSVCSFGADETVMSCPADCGGGTNPPSGGGGGGSITPLCSDSCFSLGFSCGEQLICGSLVNCGTCPLGSNCISGQCILNCTQNWNCSEWSNCVNGEKTRVCNDLNNCATDNQKPIEKDFCSSEIEELFVQLSPIDSISSNSDSYSSKNTADCNSNYLCSEWSECNIKPVFDDLISGIQEIKGQQDRDCIDRNNCKIPKRESRVCIIKIIVETKKANFCNEEYLEIYNKETGQLVSRILDKKTEEIPSLNIDFVNNEKAICKTCFNGKIDNGEEGIDCGGFCNSCEESYDLFLSPNLENIWKENSFLINLTIFSILGVLILLIIFLNVYKSEIDSLIDKGLRYFYSGDRNNARKIYLNLKYLYENKYSGNVSIYNKIQNFYNQIIQH